MLSTYSKTCIIAVSVSVTFFPVCFKCVDIFRDEMSSEGQEFVTILTMYELLAFSY